MSVRTMTTKVIAGLAAVTALSATAAQVNWLGEDGTGNGDLAVASNYSDGAVPELVSGDETNTPIVYFRADTGNRRTEPYIVTTSKDLSLNELRLTQDGPQDVTFDLKGHTLTLWGSTGASIWPGENHYSGHIFRFVNGTFLRNAAAPKSGIFRMSSSKGGNQAYIQGSGTKLLMDQITFGENNSLLCVSGGAQVYGRISSQNAAYTNAQILVTGKGTLWNAYPYTESITGSGRRTLIFDNNTASEAIPEPDFTMRVSDGAVVTNLYAYWGHRGGNAHLIVDAASVFATNEFLMGSSGDAYPKANPTNNTLEVMNGGLFDVRGERAFLIGSSGGHDNAVIVSSKGKVVCDFAYFGCNTNTFGNTILVRDGGRFQSSKGLRIGRGTNDNGPTSSNNVVHVTGEGSSLLCTNRAGSVTFYGSNNGLLVEDHAVVTNYANNGNGINISGQAALPNWVHVTDGGTYVGENSNVMIGYGISSNAWLKVDNGGTIQFIEDQNPGKSMVSIGTTSQRIDCGDGTCDGVFNNRLIVGTDGSVRSRYLRIQGYGNALMISNGTVTVDYEFRTTYSNANEGGGKTTLVFAGSRPQFIFTHDNYFNWQREAKVTFQIPKEGYTTIPVMLEKATFNVSDDTAIIIEAEPAKLNRTIVLAEAPKFNLSSTLLETANAAQPEGVVLSVRDATRTDGTAVKQLVADIAGTGQGLIMIVR